MPGYIKLYRDLKDNLIWQSKPFSKGQAWIDFLFRCNHVCNKVVGYGKCEWVLRGQFISSNYKLADAWGWSESSVRLFIKLLESEGMIIKKPCNKNTLFEVTNYCVYQSIDTEGIQDFNNAQKTCKKRAKNVQKTPNKNDKNVRNKELNILSKDNIVSLPSDKVPYSNILNLFNTICNTLPKIQDIKETRQKTIRVIWKDVDSIDYFKTLFEKVNESDFLSGRNGKWMNCCFDWIIKPANRKKILEGTYTNKDATAYW